MKFGPNDTWLGICEIRDAAGRDVIAHLKETLGTDKHWWVSEGDTATGVCEVTVSDVAGSERKLSPYLFQPPLTLIPESQQAKDRLEVALAAERGFSGT